MIGYIFRNAIEILKRKPLMLWGLSLLSAVVTMLVQITGSVIPLISIPIVLTINAGMSAVYLDGYNGKEVNSKQLFVGFTKENFARVASGMLWQLLWTVIWSFVPIYGIVKSYSYSFTPYILLTDKEISPLDALKKSMQETEGYKARMFGAELLIVLAFFVLYLLFGIILLIPILGWIIGIAGIVAIIALLPLYSGIVRAGFYEEAKSGKFKKIVYSQYGAYQPPYNGQHQENGGWFCTQCGTRNTEEARFCVKCGTQKQS